MKKYLKIFAPFTFAILLGSLTLTFAQTKTENNSQFSKGDKREFGKVPPPPFGFNPRALEQIGLTDEQKAKIKELQESALTASKTYFEKLQVIQEQIKDTTESGTFDETQARALLKTRSDIQTEIEIIRLKTDSQIYNLLTAEQIAKLDLIKSQRPEFPPRDGMRPPSPPQQ